VKKKVLILSSSPRKKGNSEKLCEQFMKGSIESGNMVEKISLRDKKINYCNGCGACLERGESCPQQDDMSDVLEKMINADVIVMATPVYFYTMSAQMKTLIDRTCSRYTEINGKEFYFLITAADKNVELMNRTLEGFRAFTYCLEGAKEKGVILGTGAFRIGDINQSKTMQIAYEMGKEV
jgi:multimeric flavodoxin WrbA